MAFALESRNYLYDKETRVWAREGFRSIAYNDGDAIEQRILESISQVKDVSTLSPELSARITDWPSLYHLTPLRGNLMRPVQGLLRGKILEIGAGCGGITRFLGETGAEVLALEGSAVRARIAASRCRDLDNVTVLADAFHQFEKEPLFDVVTLIGVLEYARKFFPSPSGDPIEAMLAHARAMLRPGGVLLVAIENQLGLKYFAGYPEDHVSIPMYGLEDQYRSHEVVTFGREELKRRLADAGFEHQQWWFPFPDYKLPVSVLSERAADEETGLDLSPLLASAASIDPQRPPALFFSLESVWKPIFRNRLAGHLANSFLVAVSADKASLPKAGALAYHYAVKRRPAFAKQVAFVEGESGLKVEQTLLFPQAKLPDDFPLAIHLEQQAYASGWQWKQMLINKLNRTGWQVADVEQWSAIWFQYFLEQTGLVEEKATLNAHQTLHGRFIDLLPRNVIVAKDGKYHLIDQEWECKFPLELGYILFRAVMLELIEISAVAPPALGTPLAWSDIFFKVTAALGVPVLPQDFARYANMEKDFQAFTSGVALPSSYQWLLSCQLPIRYPVLTERQGLIQQRDAAVNEVAVLRLKLASG